VCVFRQCKKTLVRPHEHKLVAESGARNEKTCTSHANAKPAKTNNEQNRFQLKEENTNVDNWYCTNSHLRHLTNHTEARTPNIIIESNDC